jgi:hypothetical protein
MKNLFTFLFLFIFAFRCNGPAGNYKDKATDPEYLHRSIKAITDRIVHDISSPPQASRIYAYVTTAAYEVARHSDANYSSLAGQLHGLDPVPEPEADKEYSFTLATVQATLKVGKALVFSEDDLEKFRVQIIGELKDLGIPDAVYDRSMDYGNKVADHILAWMAKDNYAQTRTFPKYSILSDPGTWKPTPPAYMDAVEPHWNKIRTFVIDSAAQFKPDRPIPFSKDKNSAFYKEAYEVYQVGKNLTPEQKGIAFFWDCNPYVMNVKGHVMFATKRISPGGHWINIVRIVCTKDKLDLAHSAEAYVCVGLSVADAFISCWDEKYRSKVIRPETYINQYIDENWLPLLQTPPFPEYTAGHSTISNSASATLTRLLGDHFAFVDSTQNEFGLRPRTLKSFFDASDEVTVSRMYGGIHYRRACEVGKLEGRKIGNFVMDRLRTKKINKVKEN